MNRAKTCPVCGSPTLTLFLRREDVPVHQNLLLPSRESALQITRGDLTLMVCEACGFIFNQTFDLSKLSYNESYDNTQSHSSYFNQYLDELIHHLIFERDVRQCRVVEVGCGKGLFLRQLVQRSEFGNTGYGFDPTYLGPLVDLDGRLRFERRFYDPQCADIPADVVVCRHVIEHVPDPLNLLCTVKQALAHSPHARIFFETPCVQWILEHQVIWDFFYEHCSYFTAESLTTAFQLAGFEVQSVRHVFGGQYLWLEATPAHGTTTVTKDADSIPALASRFAQAEPGLIDKWTAAVQRWRARGNLALWGAGAKGVTFANLIDPARRWLSCVVDLNPHKQGHYIAGTGHPIVGYQELADYDVVAAMLLNPNYREENLRLLQELRLDVDLVTLRD